MSTLSEKIEVMKAAESGAIIQRKLLSDSEWEDCDTPAILWNWSDREYRVKPEPRRVWLRFNDDGLTANFGTSKPVGDELSEFVEVLP